ncbi:hypothetical protein K502DRAFT_350902 [Neoconidiobolus thromboides FSU 785]|nr:hypothetical protein K502DRAFT_350902 [Neoconidiobolus thromboides FSU 785]
MNLFQLTLPHQNVEQYLIRLEIDDNTCRIQLNSKIESFKPNRTYDYTSLLYRPTIKCNTYSIHSEEIKRVEDQLLKLNYPNVGSILIMSIDGDKRPLGSPQLGIYDHLFYKIDRLGYVLLPSTNQLDNTDTIEYTDTYNSWYMTQKKESSIIIKVFITILNLAFVLTQLLLLLFVVLNYKLTFKLSILLLASNIFHFGIQFLFEINDATYKATSFYNTSVLLLATLSTFCSLYHWVNSVLLMNHKSLRTLVNLTVVSIYSIYFITIVTRLVLMFYLLDYVNVDTRWFNRLETFDLILIIISFSTLLCIVLFLLLKNKLKIYNIEFSHYKKLTNCNLLLMISFNFMLLFDHLLNLFSFTSDQLFYFKLILQLFTITYNIAIYHTSGAIIEFEKETSRVNQDVIPLFDNDLNKYLF